MTERFPSINALVALEAAGRLKSLTRAAEELALTESAVSRRIAQLEEFYGTQLLLRLPRGVALTAEGELLLETVRDVLQSLRSTGCRLRGKRRRLRISMAPAIASLWLAPRLAEVQRMLPEFDLLVDSTLTLVDIAAGEADIGIRAGPGSWSGLHAVQLNEERLVVVCNPQQADCLRQPADLARANFLRNNKLAWRSWFRAAGLNWEEPQGPTYTDVRALIEAASSGQGVALCYASIAGIAAGRIPLRTPFKVSSPSPYSYYAVCSEAASSRPEIRTVIDWAGEAFKQIPAQV
jgi:DNA-binding transcriptional LysR family regulator